MSDCVGCGALIPCPDLPDSVLYSLQNQTFPYVIECPPGYNCQTGSDIYFQCCTQLLHGTLPTNPTSAQITAVLNALASQCLSLGSACGESPPPGTPVTFFWNTPQTCTLSCPAGGTVSSTVAAGLCSALTQAQANQCAYNLACAQATKLLTGCTCSFSPAAGALPGANILSPYSQTFTDSSSILGTPIMWSVFGTLPTGLSLNSSTGVLSGSPTVQGPFTFGIDGVGPKSVCRQGYSLTVVSGLTIDATTVTALSNNSFPSSGCGTFNNQLTNYPGGFPQTDPFNPSVIFGPPAWAQYSGGGSSWIVLWYSSVGDGNGPGFYIGCSSCPNGLYDIYRLSPQAGGPTGNPRGTYVHSSGFNFPGFPGTITVS